MRFCIYLLLFGFLAVQCQSNSGGNKDNDKDKGKDKGKDTMSVKNETKDKDQQNRNDSLHFGNKISEKGALSLVSALDSLGGEKEYHTKVKGKVTAVCQKKGCWMKIKNPKGDDMFVRFKDYGFFVPKDLSGSQVVMKGRMFHDTTTVKERRHYAKDAGKSEEEIKKIKEPKTQIAFKASGVKILK